MAFVAATASSQTVPPRCFEYEPEAVSVVGRIQRTAFPGPLNYSSIEDGDKREVQWVLHLSRPACVNGKVGDDLNSGSESQIKEMQLVILNQADWKRFAPLVGKSVKVTGTLFHAFTGHHRTSILLTAQSIELQTSPKK